MYVRKSLSLSLTVCMYAWTFFLVPLTISSMCGPIYRCAYRDTCMYTCICVYVSTHKQIHTYIYVCMYSIIHICMYLYICIYTHTRIGTHMHFFNTQTLQRKKISVHRGREIGTKNKKFSAPRCRTCMYTCKRYNSTYVSILHKCTQACVHIHT